MVNYKKRATTKSKKRAYKKSMPKKAVDANIKKIVRKEIRKNTEVKKVDYSWGTPTNINHNNVSSSTNRFIEKLLDFGVNAPLLGSGEDKYTGSTYKVIGQHLFLTLTIVADRLNTKFRVLILRRPAHKAAPTSYTDIFDNIVGNVMMDPVDKDVNTTLYDKIIGCRNINPTNSTDNVLIFKKIWIPRQKYAVQLEDPGGTQFKFPKFIDYLIVLAFDAQGSLVTDTLGSVQVSRRLYFVDDA